MKLRGAPEEAALRLTEKKNHPIFPRARSALRECYFILSTIVGGYRELTGASEMDEKINAPSSNSAQWSYTGSRGSSLDR